MPPENEIRIEGEVTKFDNYYEFVIGKSGFDLEDVRLFSM